MSVSDSARYFIVALVGLNRVRADGVVAGRRILAARRDSEGSQR
jgi:hypothetical protein